MNLSSTVLDRYLLRAKAIGRWFNGLFGSYNKCVLKCRRL